MNEPSPGSVRQLTQEEFDALRAANVPPTIRQTVLDTAKQYVSQDRNLDYDTPEKNFEMIAELWNAYLANRGTHPLHPYDVAVLMLLVKVARISTSPQKQDHWIDIAGYAACGAECVVEKPNA